MSDSGADPAPRDSREQMLKVRVRELELQLDEAMDALSDAIEIEDCQDWDCNPTWLRLAKALVAKYQGCPVGGSLENER